MVDGGIFRLICQNTYYGINGMIHGGFVQKIRVVTFMERKRMAKSMYKDNEMSFKDRGKKCARNIMEREMNEVKEPFFISEEENTEGKLKAFLTLLERAIYENRAITLSDGTLITAEEILRMINGLIENRNSCRSDGTLITAEEILMVMNRWQSDFDDDEPMGGFHE